MPSKTTTHFETQSPLMASLTFFNEEDDAFVIFCFFQSVRFLRQEGKDSGHQRTLKPRVHFQPSRPPSTRRPTFPSSCSFSHSVWFLHRVRREGLGTTTHFEARSPLVAFPTFVNIKGDAAVIFCYFHSARVLGQEGKDSGHQRTSKPRVHS